MAFVTRFVLTLVLTTLADCTNSQRLRPNYFIFAPEMLHVGVTENISVKVSGVTRPVNVTLFLTDYPDKSTEFAHAQGTFRPDENGFLSVKVNATEVTSLSRDGDLYAYLVVMCRDPQVPFIRETRVLISYRSMMLLVQIDKPIYTPSQTVKMRVIPLDFDLQSLKVKVDIIVKNPQGIRTQNWQKLSSEHGIISKALSLGPRAMLGNWSIIAYHHGYGNKTNTTVHFEVKQYVLPRFSVRIIGPDYILPKTRSIKIAVISKYTYGKAAQGSVTVRLSVTGGGSPSIRFYSTTEKLIDGKSTLDVDSGFIKKHPSRPWFPDGRRLQIECDVIEEATGMRESAVDNSVYFVSTPFHVTIADTALFFKPGLPFVVKIAIHYPNKQPARGIPVDVSAMGKKHNNTNVNILTKVSGKLEKILRQQTNNAGKAEFTLDIPRNVKTITVKIRTAVRDTIDPDDNAVIIISAESYFSQSNSYLHIRPKVPKVSVGQTARWDVFQNRNITSISFMVLSRGRIILHRSISSSSGVNIASTLAFPVTLAMVPRARVLAYYVTHTNEVVADSALMEVENWFPNKVWLQVPTPAKGHLPGSTVEVKLHAEAGSRVALLGVDESVYLLRKNSRLTAKQVFQAVRDLDLGCGVGPGKDSSHVFNNAGLSIISNNNLALKFGHERDCSTEHAYQRRTKRSSKESTCCASGRMPSRAKCELRARFFLGNVSVQCRKDFLKCCREETGEEEIEVYRERQTKEKNARVEEDIENQGQIRKYFPETWIFDEYQTGLDGKLALRYTLPDTITTWAVQALAVSNETGFGVTELSRVTTFKNFFIALLLPYSAQRGEQISVKAAVFNYGEQESEVEVHLTGDPTYCSSSGPGASSQPITLRIAGNDAISVSFVVVPVRLGRIPIRIVAKARLAGSHGDDWTMDAVEKDLLVVPEGVERRVVYSLVIDPQGVLRDEVDAVNGSSPPMSLDVTHDGKQISNVELAVPKGAVPGSIFASLYFTGNLIGSAVYNLMTGGVEHLLRIPIGCGEQNMITLAPNVYILEFLSSSKQVTAEIEAKAYRLIQQGYQQQLGFRRKDKSFSAFGESRPGSTWLTAFVIKVFCTAKRFDGVAIDNDLIRDSITWLLANQREDGAFPEVMDVVHVSLMGGIHGSIAMTAYVVTALLECECPGTALDQATKVAKAVHFLEQEINNLQKPQILALATYALAMARSPKATQANTRLLGMSHNNQTRGNNTRYWETGKHALDVETAAYALLAQLHLGRIKLGGPVASWLTLQRNAQGGFSSTQDTCVALQALAKYSEKTAGGFMNLQVSITSDKSAYWKKTYHVTKENALAHRKLDVTSFLGHVLFIDGVGTGVGQIQLEILYNVPSPKNETCLFDLRITTTEIQAKNKTLNGINIIGRSLNREKRELRNGIRKKKNRKKKCRNNKRKGKRCGRKSKQRVRKTKKRKGEKKSKKTEKTGKQQKTQQDPPESIYIKVCTRFRREKRSGMAIMDIGIFTGFKPDEKSLIELQKNVRPTVDRFEFSDRSVVLYINQIPNKREFCVKFQVNRKFAVGTVQPVPVTVYDYYEPSDSCTRFYSPHARSEMLLDVCQGAQCNCLEAGCSPCSLGSLSADKLLKEACHFHDFVFKGEVVFADEEHRIDEKSRKRTWLLYFLKVTSVFKEGVARVRKGQILEYNRRGGCSCPDLQVGVEYLVLGRQQSAQFVFNENTRVLPWISLGGEPHGQGVVRELRARLHQPHWCI
uniref:Complement component C3 n=1 Tax=Nematostella vectensis TaxID=45351 RepID=B9X081_NEMVE|nr:complement component C3 precursor [Nematostella vectensis]